MDITPVSRPVFHLPVPKERILMLFVDGHRLRRGPTQDWHINQNQVELHTLFAPPEHLAQGDIVALIDVVSFGAHIPVTMRWNGQRWEEEKD